METELLENEALDTEVEDRGDELLLETESDGDGLPPQDTEAEAPEEDGEGEGEEPRSIPQARFNEVNERYKQEREARLALEEELARARGGQGEAKGSATAKESEAFDLEAAEERMMDFLAEGNAEEAKALQKQIRQHEREQMKAQIVAETQAELEKAEQAKETARLQHTAQSLYQKYPELDGSGKKADGDLIEMVIALRNDYIQSGAKPADALEKAAEKVCGKLGKAQGAAAPSTAPAAAKANVTRNLEREAQIPPRGAGKGTRSQPVDLSALSDAEFSKLSAEDIARARGDYLDG